MGNINSGNPTALRGLDLSDPGYDMSGYDFKKISNNFSFVYVYIETIELSINKVKRTMTIEDLAYKTDVEEFEERFGLYTVNSSGKHYFPKNKEYEYTDFELVPTWLNYNDHYKDFISNGICCIPSFEVHLIYGNIFDDDPDIVNFPEDCLKWRYTWKEEHFKSVGSGKDPDPRDGAMTYVKDTIDKQKDLNGQIGGAKGMAGIVLDCAKTAARNGKDKKHYQGLAYNPNVTVTEMTYDVINKGYSINPSSPNYKSNNEQTWLWYWWSTSKTSIAEYLDGSVKLTLYSTNMDDIYANYVGVSRYTRCGELHYALRNNPVSAMPTYNPSAKADNIYQGRRVAYDSSTIKFDNANANPSGTGSVFYCMVAGNGESTRDLFMTHPKVSLYVSKEAPVDGISGRSVRYMDLYDTGVERRNLDLKERFVNNLRLEGVTNVSTSNSFPELVEAINNIHKSQGVGGVERITQLYNVPSMLNDKICPEKLFMYHSLSVITASKIKEPKNGPEYKVISKTNGGA